MVDGSENLETEGGYAKETLLIRILKQEELLSDTLKIDIAICTALIPGKAPIILSNMIDNKGVNYFMILQRFRGGNTAYTEIDKIIEKRC